VNNSEVHVSVVYVTYDVELIARDLRMMLKILYTGALVNTTYSNSSSLSISRAPHTSRLSYRYFHSPRECYNLNGGGHTHMLIIGY
jgi:hypothetical protein